MRGVEIEITVFGPHASFLFGLGKSAARPPWISILGKEIRPRGATRNSRNSRCSAWALECALRPRQLISQASDYTLAKVTFTGDSAAGHASLVTIAAEALGVPTPSELGAGGELNVRAERLYKKFEHLRRTK